MRQFSWFLRGSALLTLTVVSWVGRPARACSPAPCLPPLAFPSLHATLPANLVAFPVVRQNVDSLVLRVRGGEVVPASVKMVGPDRVFAPDVPLAPNQSYEVTYSCTRLNEEPQPFLFTTGDPVSPTVGSGELVIEEEGVAYPGLASNEGVFARVRFYPGSNNLGIEGPVFSTPSVDGRDVHWDGVRLANGYYVVSLMARCSPISTDFELNTCGGIEAIPARKVKLAVRSHLVGSAQDPPPATLELDLRCDRSITPTRPAPLKPGTPDMPGTSTNPASAGGCAYLPTGGRSPLAHLVGALGLALLGVRRRRRCPYQI